MSSYYNSNSIVIVLYNNSSSYCRKRRKIHYGTYKSISRLHSECTLMFSSKKTTGDFQEDMGYNHFIHGFVNSSCQILNNTP